MTHGAAADYCADRVRRHDRDRFLTALFSSPDRRPDLLAVYAFNLEIAGVREAVAEPMAGLIRLQWWRDALDAIYGGDPPAHPVARALADAVRRRGLRRAWLEAAIDARAGDLDDRQPLTPAALEAYATATSAGLVQLALQVLGVDHEASAAAGRNVGIAWALTGLLRAIPAHARQRRVYLPVSSCLTAGLSVGDLTTGRQPGPGLRKAVAEIAAVARRHLAAARGQRHRMPRAAVPALLPATLADHYLDRLEKAAFDPFALERRAAVAGAAPAAMVRLALNALRGRF